MREDIHGELLQAMSQQQCSSRDAVFVTRGTAALTALGGKPKKAPSFAQRRRNGALS